MVISDLNYLEVVSEETQVEGSGRTDFRSTRTFDLFAQADLFADTDEFLFFTADTGDKSIFYTSSITVSGLV